MGPFDGSPSVLLLDEPTEGLAPALVQRVHELVITLAEEGIAVLLVSPSPARAVECARTLTVLTSGRMALRSTARTPVPMPPRCTPHSN